MQIKASTIREYFEQLPEDRKKPMRKLQRVIKQHLPSGFEERMQYSMPSYVVPHNIYPDGYHCSPEIPLPFVSIASQKNFIALYHMGIYANNEIHYWFVKSYPNHCKSKLDMGKSCIRFKKPDDIPYDLIAELMSKMTPHDWIMLYEMNYRKKK